ncbi:MAG: hypothetical protein KA270_17710 [Saprospiraceae bacterium]|nr:hypothetical protein [Saprospiraceae bacterium]MBP6569016.1 hypothetical protein [Saprospiraceae bacterium]
MEISQYLSTSRMMAFISFIIGTLIFALHCVAPQENGIMIFGFFYVIVAIIANFIMFLILIGIACIRMDSIDEIAKSLLLLMANIPIAIIYFLIVMGT